MKKVSIFGIVALVATAMCYEIVARSSAEAQSGSRGGRPSYTAQSGSRGGRPSSTAQSGSRAGGQSFEAKLWSWLQDVKYRNWAPGPGQNGDYYPGDSPHGAFLKLYLNRTAVADLKKLPHGSIIVKENYGKDRKTLMAVTVMYRTRGYDPEHYDWYWVKYKPDGSVARTPAEMGNKPIAGRFRSCIECHGDADGDDFAFANDK